MCCVGLPAPLKLSEPLPPISFQNVITFNMDEYVGLAEDHPESYHSFMFRELFSKGEPIQSSGWLQLTLIAMSI
jgi:6-phosphogluconolactonase/glucosamine-6-phosphate isomerase/deaminase